MRMDGAKGIRGAEVVGQGRPVAEDGREMISVRGVLEWAFGVEYASLDYDEIGAVAGEGFAGIGSEYRIMRQLELGDGRGKGVRVDTSFGVSHPHEDADLVASILRASVPWHTALAVAELARTCRVPRWDIGTPRLLPRSWGKRNHIGQMGKAEVIREVAYVVRGRRRVRRDLWVPCAWVPSAAEVASARRHYLDWWGALLAVQGSLRSVELRKFHIIEAMPPREPWKKCLTQSSSY